MKNVEITISRIVGGGICVAADDGQRVYGELSRVIEAGDRAVLSFENITRMTTAFLNAAVGQLYGEFSEDVIRKHLAPPIKYEAWHLDRLQIVVLRAKEYFKNIDRAESVIRGATGEGDDI